MKRFLAFASVDPSTDVTLDDFKGDFDTLKEAREAVHKREADGLNSFDQGAVVDTATGEIRDWCAAISPFGDDRWYAARPMGGK